MPADDDDDTRRRTPRPSDAEYDPRRTIDLIPGLFLTVRPDGEVEHANQQLLEFVGQSLEELRAWGTNGTVHADDIERINAAWTYALTTGTHYDVEQRLRCHDGQYRWVQVRAYPMVNRAGDIVRWHVQILDFDAHKAKLERLRRNELRLSRALTEQTLARKASEDAVAALRATERELTHMIESIPVYALCTDTAGVITYINQRFLQALGATLDQLRTGWPDFIHPDDRDLVLGSWVRAVASGEGYRLAMRIRHPGGHYRWIDAIHQLARDKSGAPERWYALLFDVDDHHRAEEALKETRARLAVAARVATVAELSASIAHEVTQPLSAIAANAYACSNWLNADPPNIAKAHQTAETVVKDAARAGETITRLRNLFRRRPVERIQLSMNELVESVVQLVVGEAHERQITLETFLEPSLPLVPADKIQLQQVVLNLLNNAVDALDGVAGRARAIVVRSSLALDALLIEVEDSGVGLDAPAKVFEPFFTTKPQGLGMGLSICRWIIESHGGKLWAEAREGHGTSFLFTLPLTVPDTPSSPAL
jgi:PAS domain S-box-containing protein